MEIKQVLRSKNKKGAALMYTMMFLMLMSVIIVSFSLVSVNMYKTTAVSASKEQSFLFAKTIGQVFALQLAEDIDATSIVSYLEMNAQSAPTVKGTAKISFDPDDDSISSTLNNALKGTNLTKEDLSRINIPDAQLKFYFNTTCAKCGAHLEDLPKVNNEYYCQSPTCKNKKISEKNINKKYLYLDVTVSYNGATEVVTTVFTYLDQTDFTQTMYDLFSVYNIYSTYPSEMEFTFTGDLDSSSKSPNVYLYNGVDSESEGYGEIVRDTYTLRANVNANLTSTGDVKITSKSGSTLAVKGRITSYGSMVLSQIETDSMYMKGDLTVEKSAKVNGTIYARNNVTVTGYGNSAISVGGKIYAMGNVVISSANVGEIIGGPGCNVTLRNSTCTKISTGGAVTLENSKVSGSVICDGNLKVTNSIIGGTAYTKGDCVLELKTTSQQTVIGAPSIDRIYNSYYSSTALQVDGDLQIQNLTTNSNLAVNGGIIVGGSIKAPQNARCESIVTGGIDVKGFLKETILGYNCNVCYLIGLNVYGGVNLESYSDRACIPLFGKGNTTAPGVSSKIAGVIKVNGNLILGDYFQDVLLNENKDDQNESFNFRGEISRYINLFDSTVNTIQAQAVGANKNPTQVFLTKGTITGGIVANQIVLSNINVSESAKINASGSNGCVIAVDKSVLSGQIIARTAFSLHRGSILSGTNNGFVHVYGFDNPETPIHGVAYIDGEVYGELVVGTSLNSGNIIIKKNALLGGNDYDKAIYINGDLYVREHSSGNITNSPELYAPRLRTQNNNGNKIYLTNGTAHLRGWVYDLYIKEGELEKLDEVAGCCGEPYIKGTTYVETAFVFVGKDGLKDSEGATYTNENVIVYVYEDTPLLGDLTISGTLVLKRGVTLNCKSLKVNRVLSDYDGQILTPTNSEIIKQELTNTVSAYDFNNTSVKKLKVVGDTQINQPCSGTFNISDSEFGGWLKIKNATGTVVFQNSSVTCATLTTYANGNDKYKGCLDVTGANLSLVNSYIGGTSARSNVDPDSTRFEGNVYCNILQMDGGAIYGTAYTLYAETLKNDAKISGGLHMSSGVIKSVSWTGVFIDNFIFGPNIGVSIERGVLCGLSANSSNQSANLDSNEHFVYLKELNMKGTAVLAQYTTVYIKNGDDSSITGMNIGNVYAITKNLNIYQCSLLASKASVKGYVYCEGNLTYSSAVTPSAERGLFAGNSDVVITDSKITNILSGGVTLPNYTKDIKLSSVKGNVTIAKANSLVLTGNVYGDVHAKNLTIENSMLATIEGNILVSNDMKIESTSNTLTVGVSNNVNNANTLTVNRALYIYSSSRYVNMYSFVRCKMLAVNFKKGSSDIAVTEKSISQSSYSAVTTSSIKYIRFYENVLVDLIDSNSGGNAYISNAEFKGSSGSAYHGATLFTARSVLAVKSDFYGAGYKSMTQHTYTTALGSYNTNNSSYYTTNFGSIVAWLGTSSSTTSKTSYSYAIYLKNVNCYSNITQLESSLSSEFNSTFLGQSFNVDSANNLEKRNYTKLYSIAGNLVLNGTTVHGISYSKSGDPLAYTLLDVKGNLELKSTIVGENFETYTCDEFNKNGIKSDASKSREHNQRSIKGIYVGGNMTIDSSSTVYINIYVKQKLTNAGNIILQKRHFHSWDATTIFAGERSYSHFCGGEIQVGSYVNTGYNSIEELGTGSAKLKNNEYNDKHNIAKATYDFCTDNLKAFTKGGSVATCSIAINKINSVNTAKGFVSDTTSVKSENKPSLNILKSASNPILGLEWDSTESLIGRIKDPLYTIEVNLKLDIPTTPSGLVRTNMPTTILDTSNRAYWYPQAIPLRWYLPTQTTAGDNVSLNGRAGSQMTVSEKKLGESIDALERAQNDFKRLGELRWYEWLTDAIDIGKSLWNNAKAFFTNLPTLFKPSSSYIGLNFASKEDAYYYRVSAKNSGKVLTDAGGSDLLVITRRCMVVKDTFPKGDILEGLIKHVGWNPDWVLPTSYSFNQRPVGLVFFNSGIVPDDVFIGDKYRKYSKVSTEKDSEGRWYWGDGGNEGWYGTASPANDVVWTFFTCEDPNNPYTSKAKDLHIVLPANAKMVWEKDKDSCVNIIGNGRVFLYLQDGTDIKVVGNGFTHAIRDKVDANPTTSAINNWFSQWSNGDATYNVFGGVRYVATIGDGIDERTYYDASGNILMDEKALAEAQKPNSKIHVQQQPRMYIVGTGGNISFEVQDFQTAAYVYMPSGYSYGDKSARNTFKISSNNNAEGYGYWDVYGIYVCDNFAYGNDTGAKVRYFKTSPDLSNTSFKRTYYSGNKASSTSNPISSNRSSYQLAEFWDYPTDLPVSSMNWYYRGLALN